MIITFIYFCACSALGKRPEVKGADRRRYTELIGPLFTSYFLWLIRPVERAFVAAGVSPNVLTLLSLVLCAGAGLAVAGGFLATAAWSYILAGTLDVLDGRLARATNRSSKAGAFLDSVADRWGELLVLAGFAWFLRESMWLLAALLAVAGSVMVSYTRARGEGLGLELDGGTMQRAERILIVSVGTIVAAWLEAADATAGYGVHVIGACLAATGIGSTITSIGRWREGYRLLEARERGRGGVVIAATDEGSGEARPDSQAA
jgi:phosphatidylglycerophosphate synthase